MLRNTTRLHFFCSNLFTFFPSSSSPLFCSPFLLKKLANVLSKEQLLSDLIPLIDSLSRDEQDSVRLLVVEAVIAVAEKLDPEETKIHLLPILKNMISDRSWRVRYMIAEKYVTVSLTLSFV
jgi:serine/threonine-protein phosphatase 2A regulatory subunit A